MSTGTPEDRSESRWESFHGHLNSPRILTQKAEVTSSLILYSLELPWDLIRVRGGSILGAGEERRREMCDIETAALYLRLVEEISSSCLTPNAYEEFNDELLLLTSQKLSKRFRQDSPDWVPHLLERFDQYAHYKKWLGKPGESQSGTLLWEYAKAVATISGIEKDAAFNISLGSVISGSFRRWELRELLTESR
jgi:hypothetical protein